MNENDLNAYRKITAPTSIRERLIAEKLQERKKHRITAAFCYGIAGVAAMMILAFTFLYNNSAVLYLNNSIVDNEEVFAFEFSNQQKVRTISASIVNIPLTVETDTDTEITVSHGVITVEGEDRGQKIIVSENTNFIWVLETDTDAPCLEIKKGKDGSLYTISRKDGTEKFYLKKVN